MERRQYDASEIRVDGGEQPVLVGHAAVFDTLSLEMWGFREKVAPGAFTDTLGKDDIRALWNHDTGLVLGRVAAGTGPRRRQAGIGREDQAAGHAGRARRRYQHK